MKQSEKVGYKLVESGDNRIIYSVECLERGVGYANRAVYIKMHK